MLQELDPQTHARAYLDAFHARDLTACMSFFADGATLTFYTGHFNGRSAIESWHQERFAADLRLTSIERVAVEHDVVTIEGSATSIRLRAWKINSINGVIQLLFRDGKIHDAKFSPRLGPLEMLS